MDERELFTRDFEGTSSEELWAAVKRGLATWDLKDAEDATATARFDTSDWTWSWGEHLLAQVEEGMRDRRGWSFVAAPRRGY